MEKFTLLELHLDEASFTANANGSAFVGEESAESEESAEDEGAAAPESGTAGGRGGRLLLAVVVLLVLVAVARALSGDEELDDLSDLDDAA